MDARGIIVGGCSSAQQRSHRRPSLRCSMLLHSCCRQMARRFNILENQGYKCARKLHMATIRSAPRQAEQGGVRSAVTVHYDKALAGTGMRQ